MHGVDIYLPTQVQAGRALLILNNGISRGAPRAAPTDFSPAALAQIAQATGTAVICVSDVPNQYLVYEGDGRPRREDESVARSWTLFMDAPELRQQISLHIPMAAAASLGMTLAQRELPQLSLEKFIVSGVSKRGWATWLASLGDDRVDAIAPFVFDLLDTRAALRHMYRSYGGNWPMAFHDYYSQQIDQRLDSSEFEQLMQIEDPLQYQAPEYLPRLSIPQYIINASGDDFYAPDNSHLYFDRLPGAKAQRAAPNCSHRGILAIAGESLTRFVNRIQANRALPVIQSTFNERGPVNVFAAQFSEPPASVKLWHASNLQARDFRFSSGIRYRATAIPVDINNNVRVVIPVAKQGWEALFLEATFEDGFVATTPVYVTPRDTFPEVARASIDGACGRLAGRAHIDMVEAFGAGAAG